MQIQPVLRSSVGRILAGALSALALAATTITTATAAPRTVVDSDQTVEMKGVSGGPSLVLGCSEDLPEQASQEIQLSDAFIQQSGFLKFMLEAEGNPVLVLEGPAGRFCSLGDQAAQQQPEVTGYWLPGVYRVYVGDRDGLSQPYKLSVVRVKQ